MLDSIAARLEFLNESDAMAEAKDFQRFDEAGLAWDMLVFIANKHIAQVPGDVLRDIVRLAVMMKIDVKLTHSAFA